MKRYVYAFDSIEATQPAIKALLDTKITEDRISLIARSDIESERIPPNYLDVTTDFAPAMVRGATIGSATGLAVAIVAMIIPSAGIVAGGPTLLAFLAGGAMIGAWSSAMIGSSIPDTIRRKFEDQIETGRILLIVDSDPASDFRIRRVLFDLSNLHLIWQSSVRMQKF